MGRATAPPAARRKEAQMSQIIRPTGVERTFGADEVIVTKTDLKGRISCRVSALTEADALGAPHNVIRHPEMPRGVFRLLWSTLAAREEIFAYVVNLAADGAHYWVHAHVTPSLDGAGNLVGYHSNRRVPDQAAVRAIRPVYQRMLAEEARHARAADAAQAGLLVLEESLAEQGTTYDRFVWSLTAGSAA